MAKTSVKERNKKRGQIVAKYATKRAEYKAKAVDLELPLEERMAWQHKLQELPRDSSQSRYVRRCRMTGRAHGVLRRFGLARNKFRELAMQGHIPGLVKSSW